MKTLGRLTALAVVGSLIAVLGVPAANAIKKGGPRDYAVTLTNLTENQILTPPVFAAHTQAADVFDIGTPASKEVQEIAENGNLAPLAEALPGVRGVKTSGIGAGAEGPLGPGAVRSFEFSTHPRAWLFSTVQMVVCTNDAFTGLDSVQLPRHKGETVHIYVFAWDAGTEKNTDAFVDFVPPCSPEGIGTGESNPALAENGFISPHPGLSGEAKADFAFDPDAAVAVYEITRVG